MINFLYRLYFFLLFFYGLQIAISIVFVFVCVQGMPAHQEMIDACLEKGYDLSQHRARQVRRDDFNVFDMIVALDRENLEDLQSIAPREQREKLHLLLEFDPEAGILDVPDPYFCGGHDRTLEIVESAVRKMLLTFV